MHPLIRIASQYDFNTDALLHQLNVEAAANPRLIPLLLEVIRYSKTAEDGNYDVQDVGGEEAPQQM